MLFVWNGERYEFVADMLGVGVVGYWVGFNQRDIFCSVEYIKLDRNRIREKPFLSTSCHPEQSEGPMQSPASCTGPSLQRTQTQDDNGFGTSDKFLSFRFMEPLEEAVYLDQVRLMAVDHPADVDVYPNEYFASAPPFPEFRVIASRNARPPHSARDGEGRDVLPQLLHRDRRYVTGFDSIQFPGFSQMHYLELELPETYTGGTLRLLMQGYIEYFSATSGFAAHQAGIE